MNKKLIALALILLIAVGGVFAAVTLPEPTVVKLKGTVGDYFYHGIVVDGEFVAQKEYTNAFQNPPSFDYGYETNAAGAPYYIYMNVGNFLQTDGDESGVVKIKSVTVGGSAPTWSDAAQSYLLFTVPTNNTYSSASKPVVITALDAVGGDHRGVTAAADETYNSAPAGEYEATITFSVSGP